MPCLHCSCYLLLDRHPLLARADSSARAKTPSAQFFLQYHPLSRPTTNSPFAAYFPGEPVPPMTPLSRPTTNSPFAALPSPISLLAHSHSDTSPEKRLYPSPHPCREGQ